LSPSQQGCAQNSQLRSTNVGIQQAGKKNDAKHRQNQRIKTVALRALSLMLPENTFISLQPSAFRKICVICG
jgi:hypothetical protein